MATQARRTLSAAFLLFLQAVVGRARGLAGDVPGVLDCSYDEEWSSFREALRRNADLGWPFEDEIFERADKLIARHLLTFLAFHRSKSNEFFHDCDREEPRGVVCLYGMLSAFFVHHIYLRHKIESQHDKSSEVREIYGHSTSLARLMLINKNNCLDFLDSSNWPLSLAQLVAVLSPTEVGTAQPPPVQDHWAQRGLALTRLGPRWPQARAGAPEGQHDGGPVVVYVTGTHAALAREPAEMLRRFAGPLLGRKLVPVLEVVDEQHCGVVDCSGGEQGQQAAGPLAPLGLSELMSSHLRPRWNGLDIEDFQGLAEGFRRRFEDLGWSRKVDLFVCTTPAVLCLLFEPFDRPLLAYLGEPLLLSVAGGDRAAWWARFDALASAGRSFFTCYNPFLAAMVEYQTGLMLPVIRLHGLYTDAVYSPTRLHDVLVIKGPNICVDPACLLNRFATGGFRPGGRAAAGRAAGASNGTASTALWFAGLDELGGAPYPALAAFRAAVIYPYDVALAIFYELYSMCLPLFVPRTDLLPFYVFRGLHSHRDYHHVRPGPGGSGPWPGASAGLPPFVPPLDVAAWFGSGRFWSDRTDFARFPHLIRFGAVAELLAALAPGATDWAAISSSMRRFNDETLAVSAAQWAAGVSAVLSRSAGASRAGSGGAPGYTATA